MNLRHLPLAPSLARLRTTCAALLLAGCALPTAVAAAPFIDVWYGDHQRFGHLGNPQSHISIVGSVEQPGEVESLSYSLNGAPERPLTMGPDLRRLAWPGDFNIEIDRALLRKGANEIVIRAARSAGAESVSAAVRVDYTAGRTWPLPYRVDWSKAKRIQDVAEVVEGLWKLTPQGIRTVEPGYDRVIAIGDLAWTDYEAVTSVVFHQMFADEIVPTGPPFSNHSHASLLLRWGGHREDGKQPRAQWRPTGGLAMLRADAKGPPGNRWIWHGGETGFLAEETDYRSIEIGKRYFLKGRVESLPGPRTRYSIKIWEDGESEPPEWDLVGVDGPQDLQSGSLLLVVHHSDVTFGNVEVRPLDR